MSEAFRDLVGDAFVFEERGVTELKGLGAARTYFLPAPRPAAQSLNYRMAGSHVP